MSVFGITRPARCIDCGQVCRWNVGDAMWDAEDGSWVCAEAGRDDRGGFPHDLEQDEDRPVSTPLPPGGGSCTKGTIVANFAVEQHPGNGSVTVTTPKGVHVFGDPDEVIANGWDLVEAARSGKSRGYVARVGMVDFGNAARMGEFGKKMMEVRGRD